MKSFYRIKCYSVPIILQTHTHRKNTLCSLNRNQKISRRRWGHSRRSSPGVLHSLFYGLPRDKWATRIRSAVIEEASQLSAGKTHPPAVNPLLGLDSVNLSRLHFAFRLFTPKHTLVWQIYLVLLTPWADNNCHAFSFPSLFLSALLRDTRPRLLCVRV